jgi:endonuclease YncB( thermonuclease family)
MQTSRITRLLFLIALPLAAYSSGSAAALQGKVSDVFDGESIAILSQTHTLKIKLIGVATPEKDQAYSASARQHLADLILNKFVMVRYSALREGYLVGQVMLGEMDVSGQMIRDGVAWYKPNEGDLTELDRKIYEASQAAARTERRGLWQDEMPQSPWDFREAQRAKLIVANMSLAPEPRHLAPMRRGTQAGLSSEDLMGGALQPGSIAGRPDIRQLSSDRSPGRWLRYQSADRHFSILAPSDGLEVTYPVLDGQGKTIDLHYVFGSNDRNFYFVMWTKGPQGKSTDLSAAADSINGLLSGINRANARNGGIVVTATPGRSWRLNGYAGRQYALDAGPVFGVVRVFTKQMGEEREVLLLCALSVPEAEAAGDEFLNSFKIR